MSSPSTGLLRLQKLIPGNTLQYVAKHAVSNSSRIRFHELKDRKANLRIYLRCRVNCNPRSIEQTDVYPYDLPPLRWSEVSVVNEEPFQDENEIKHYVDKVRSMLVSMGDGEISIGAYDTAWVALIENNNNISNGNGGPQFPSSLEWITNNQLPDGSWGDPFVFEIHERLISTLACVVALKKWNIHPYKTQKGILFVQENICKLKDANANHMAIGFEVAFLSLIKIAQERDIEVPTDVPALQDIYSRRNLKLKKIPNDIFHTVPTALLYSLEGMSGLDWQKIIKLQLSDGSFCNSPSATAFALTNTKDENCMRYISRIVKKFNGGVPTVYPVDLFERVWAVDRLERLGISRYFSSEIENCIDYVHRYWTDKGVSWARNSSVQNIDDTSMSFRLLRLHGRKVSAVNRKKQVSNNLLDKWIIAKDLPGEVEYALDVPWYASLPRVETRFYIDQYGGRDDVWIGKTLYRMHNVCNNTYLELARLDYNNCQVLHQLEWDSIQKWYKENNLEMYGMSQRSLLSAYFLAAATIFEPERWSERVAWAKTVVLVETIRVFFDTKGSSFELKKKFLNNFRYYGTQLQSTKERKNRVAEDQLLGLVKTLNEFMLDIQVALGRDISHNLRHTWEMWMMTWQEEGYRQGSEAELLLTTIYLCGSHRVKDELLAPLQPLYQSLFDITSRVCLGLCQAHQPNKVIEGDKNEAMVEIESEMQKLVELVVAPESSDGMDPNIKKIFLMIAKTYYYTNHVSPATLDSHIAKVLFQNVV